jgi:hypothetical protein
MHSPACMVFLQGLSTLLSQRIKSPGAKSASHSMVYSIAAHLRRQLNFDVKFRADRLNPVLLKYLKRAIFLA